MKFISHTQMNMVMARGAISGLSKWNICLTWLSMVVSANSTKFCHLPGTPAVAASGHQKEIKNSPPRPTEKNSVSRFNDQKPWPTVQ